MKNQIDFFQWLENAIPSQLDSYKDSHSAMWSKKIDYVLQYYSARGGEYSHTLICGFEAAVYNTFIKPFTQKLDEAKLEQLQAHLSSHLGSEITNELVNDLKHIAQKYPDGKLPLRILAAQDGEIVPVGMPLITVENTVNDPVVARLGALLETALMRSVWYPMVVATRTANLLETFVRRYIKSRNLIEKATIDGVFYPEKLKQLIDDLLKTPGLMFAVNDFGLRGVSSHESAIIAGLAHLSLSSGTDNQAAIAALLAHYTPEDLNWMPAYSVPATEHSITTSEIGLEEFRHLINSKQQGEFFTPEDSLKIKKRIQPLSEKDEPSETAKKAYTTLFERAASGFENKEFGVVSIVIDTQSNPIATAQWFAKMYKDKWSKDEKYRHVRLVLRPDSGDPVKLIPKLLDAVAEIVGKIPVEEGSEYYVLNSNIGVIQGDSITGVNLEKILDALLEKGWDPVNLITGTGGYLVQKLNRDTLKMAAKVSEQLISYNEHYCAIPLAKTASGKKSFAGRVVTLRHKETGEYLVGYIQPENNQYFTESELASEAGPTLANVLNDDGKPLNMNEYESILKPLFYNGELRLKYQNPHSTTKDFKFSPFNLLRKDALSSLAQYIVDRINIDLDYRNEKTPGLLTANSEERCDNELVIENQELKEKNAQLLLENQELKKQSSELKLLIENQELLKKIAELEKKLNKDANSSNRTTSSTFFSNSPDLKKSREHDNSLGYSI